MSANDKIRLGVIGVGIMGHNNIKTALKVEGTELIAVCDLYEGRLERIQKLYGKQVVTTFDYQEILARQDIDAVIIATPDHWHDRISIEALQAGKHVYCEKPMVHKIAEGRAVIEAEKANGKVFMVGSQRVSSVVDEKEYANVKEEDLRTSTKELVAPEGSDAHLAHFIHFFNAIRSNGKVVEDASFGLRACAPALASNKSIYEKKVVEWNPETMELK